MRYDPGDIEFIRRLTDSLEHLILEGEIKDEVIPRLEEILEKEESGTSSFLEKSISENGPGEIDIKTLVELSMGTDDEPTALCLLYETLCLNRVMDACLAAGEVLFPRNKPPLLELDDSHEKKLAKHLESGLLNEDEEVRWVCAWTMLRINQERALEACCRAIPRAEKRPKFEMARILGFLKDERATPCLLEALKEEKEEGVAVATIRWALEEIEGGDRARRIIKEALETRGDEKKKREEEEKSEDKESFPGEENEGEVPGGEEPGPGMNIKEHKNLEGHEGIVYCCSFLPNGKRVLSGGSDGLRICDAESGKQKMGLTTPCPVESCALSSEGKRVAAIAEKTLIAWDLKKQEAIPGFSKMTGPARCCSFSPDGKLLLTAHDDATLRVWDVKKMEQLATIRGHVGPVTLCAFSPDGNFLASSGDDMTIRIWEAGVYRELNKISGILSETFSFSFSADGKRLASSSRNGKVHVWVVTSGDRIITLQGHKGAVFSCAFSPDGYLVVSGGADNTIRLWDAGSGQEVGKAEGHRGPVKCCAFSPDGKFLLSCGRDGMVKLWKITEES